MSWIHLNFILRQSYQTLPLPLRSMLKRQLLIFILSKVGKILIFARYFVLEFSFSVLHIQLSFSQNTSAVHRLENRDNTTFLNFQKI